MIFQKLPVSLRNFKYFLINNAFSQLALVVLAFTSQYRFLINSTSLAILSPGPCRFFGPEACFANYIIYMVKALINFIKILAILQAVVQGSEMAILVTIVFRFIHLAGNRISKKQSTLLIILSYIFPVYNLVRFLIAGDSGKYQTKTILDNPFTAPWDYTTVQKLTALEHPSYNLSSYYSFPGFSDIGSFQFVSATINIGFGGYAIPIACIILTNKGLTRVRKNRYMSDATKELAIKFIYGLLVQSIIPAIAYIPMITSYLF